MYLIVIKQLILPPWANHQVFSNEVNGYHKKVLASMLSSCGKMSLFSCKIFSMINECVCIKKYAWTFIRVPFRIQVRPHTLPHMICVQTVCYGSCNLCCVMLYAGIELHCAQGVLRYLLVRMFSALGSQSLVHMGRI